MSCWGASSCWSCTPGSTSSVTAWRRPGAKSSPACRPSLFTHPYPVRHFVFSAHTDLCPHDMWISCNSLLPKKKKCFSWKKKNPRNAQGFTTYLTMIALIFKHISIKIIGWINKLCWRHGRLTWIIVTLLQQWRVTENNWQKKADDEQQITDKTHQTQDVDFSFHPILNQCTAAIETSPEKVLLYFVYFLLDKMLENTFTCSCFFSAFSFHECSYSHRSSIDGELDF